MKRTLAVLALLLASAVHAEERYAGTLVSTSPTAVNNATTAAPFALTRGASLAVQCDAPAYVTVVQGAATLATSTTGVLVDANVLFDVEVYGSGIAPAYLSALAVTGTANCRVFLVLKKQSGR